jgi:hypothetical protein
MANFKMIRSANLLMDQHWPGEPPLVNSAGRAELASAGRDRQQAIVAE